MTKFFFKILLNERNIDNELHHLKEYGTLDF